MGTGGIEYIQMTIFFQLCETKETTLVSKAFKNKASSNKTSKCDFATVFFFENKKLNCLNPLFIKTIRVG